MPELEETIRGLSPGALRLFRQQLPERLKVIGELERNTILEQLSAMPEFKQAPQPQPQPQAQEKQPLWQKPLQWLRGVETGAGALLSAAVTPAVEGTEGLSWWEREKAEYEAWEAPSVGLGFNYPQWLGGEEATLGVKGALELTPWFATTLATAGLGGMAALGAKTGITSLTRAAQLGAKAIRPVIATERAITTAPFKAVGLALKPIKKFVLKEIPDIARFTAPANDILEKELTKMDWQRRVAQTFGRIPILKSITERIGGKAALVTEAVEDQTLRALLIGTRVQERLMSKGQVALASLGRIHQNPARLFGIEEATGIAKNVTAKVKGASLHIADIAENPTRYKLTDVQKTYIQQVWDVEDWVLDGLKTAGIEVNQLKFAEFSHWVHREVIGKNIDEAIVKLRKGGGKIGTKAGWEKQRFYEEAAKGVEAGILYEPSLERITELYIQSAAKRISDQRIAGVVASLGEKPIERAWARAPQVMLTAKERAVRYSGSLYTVKILNRAIRGEKLAEATLSAVERKMPELGGRLREVITAKPKVKPITGEVPSPRKGLPLNEQPEWYQQSKTATRGLPEDVFNKLEETSKGVYIGLQTPIDKLFSKKSTGVQINQAQELWSAYDGVRNLLRKQYGDTITLYRAQGKGRIPDRNTLNFVESRAEAKRFASLGAEAEGVRPIISRQVPIDDILAIQTGKSATGIYREFIVANSESTSLRRPVRQLGQLPVVEAAIPKVGKIIPQIETKPALQQLLKEAKAISEEAKAPFWKAKAKRVELMAVAKTPTLGTEATIFHPAFQGKIYPKSVAAEIQRYWDDMGWGPLNKAAEVSGQMRTLVAAADFSAMFIQGLPMIALHPKAWAKGALASFRTFKNPKLYDEYLVKNLETLMERANAGGYVGGFEYMEAMPALQKTAGMAARLLTGKTEPGRRLVRQTYGRFEASFGSFGDVARNEMWKAFKTSARSPDELAEIARHLDRMTGVMSSKGLGIGKTQRSFEQAFLFFAPRYTRAGFALIGDIFKGGLTGVETRKALGSMMAAGAMFYTGIAEMLGQEPNFDPTTGKFMTIEIKDPITDTTRHFGLGGMMTSMMRFGADATASMIGMGSNEPLDFVKLDRVDNPFIRFMFSKSAPLTGFIEGMVFGHNYFGEPFENIGDYASFLGEQVTPIAFQQALTEEGGFGLTSIAAEELGMRVFPRSDWEKRDIMRDDVAQKTYGMKWDDVGTQMGRLYQERLTRDNTELQEANQLAQESSSKMARGEGKVWDLWRKEGQAVEDTFKETITLASSEFEAIGDGTTFREKVDEAYAIRRAMYASRERDTLYAEIQGYFNEPLDQSTASKMNPKDFARREYYQIMYSPDMYDEFGNYRFDLADQREAYFVQKYGQAVLDYVEEYMGAKWIEPRALQSLHSARQTLKPYWDIETQVWKQYPSNLKQISDQIKILERTNPIEAKQLLFKYPQILMARKIIALYKKQLKMQRPDIANALNMYYRY